MPDGFAYNLSDNIFGKYGSEASITPDCFARIVSFSDRDTREIIPEGERNAGLASPKVALPRDGRILGGIHAKSATELDQTTIYTVQSEILNCTVSHGKGGPAGSMTMTLKGTTDWKSAVGRGDHVCVWMKRSTIDLRSITSAERDQICTANADSGLKFYGTINSVTRNFSVDERGHKTITYSVSAVGWGDFLNRDIFFNQYLYEQFIKNPALFGAIQTSGLDPEALLKQGINGILTPDQITESLINTFLSIPNNTFSLVTSGDALKGINKPIRLPNEIARIFKAETSVIEGSTILGDIIRKQFGILDYSIDSLVLDEINEQQGGSATLRPLSKCLSGGIPYIPPAVGSNQSLWGILSAFADLSVNELFVDLRPDGRGLLGPTIIHRQIPFTTTPMSEVLRQNDKLISHTRFVDLPRICIDARSIVSESIGSPSDGGYNFIQVAPTFQQSVAIMEPAASFAKGNWAIDTGSIRRYGLRTCFLGTNFSVHPGEIASEEKQNFLTSDHAAKLASVISDWWFGYNLYDAGSITILGVEEPLCLGDNLLIKRPNGHADELFHIEGYSHQFSINGGRKKFRTSLTVTRGQTVGEIPLYRAERSHADWPNIGSKYDMRITETGQQMIVESHLTPVESQVEIGPSIGNTTISDASETLA